ncbi:MAG: hypothetical protein WEB09_05200 [Nitriliruptor sp.]
MDDTTAPAATALVDARLDERRDCTRCDGTQHLVGAFEGLGKYRCDTCGLIVGFDLDADPAEFLLDRGMPRVYTKDVFGPQLLGSERRLN